MSCTVSDSVKFSDSQCKFMNKLKKVLCNSVIYTVQLCGTKRIYETL